MTVGKTRKKRETTDFLKGVKSLPQKDQTWEVEFRMLPKSLMQSETKYLGVVVCKTDGSLLAQSQIDDRPKPEDLSALLSTAMLRPLIGKAHRPSRLHVRGHRQWQEFFPLLVELGIEVSVRQELPKAKAAYKGHLKQMRKARRSGMVRPSEKQSGVEKLFPAIARWVQGSGHIEIGDQESFGFTVRAIDYGGVVFEDDKAETLAEAMTVLEQALVEHFEQEDVE